MLNLNEIVRGGTFCLSKAGLKIGNGDAKDVDIAAPNGAGVDFCINGVLYHLADGQDKPLTVHATQAALTTCIYLVCLDSAGTLSSVKGEEVLTADLTAGTKVLQFPTPVADTCPIGYVKVATAAATTFTTGTTELSAAGITDTYVDLFAIPAAPLTS